MSIISVSTVNAILQAEDIEGLLELGAPKDEYSREAVTIMSKLEAIGPRDATEDQVSSLVGCVWADAFDLSGEDVERRSPAFRRVARQILKSYLQSTGHS